MLNSTCFQLFNLAVSLAKVAHVDRNLEAENIEKEGFREAITLLEPLNSNSEETALEQLNTKNRSEFSGFLVALKMEIDDSVGMSGENVKPLTDDVAKALSLALESYYAYLDSFGPDELYLRKKVENELGMKLIHLKMRCSGLGGDWGKKESWRLEIGGITWSRGFAGSSVVYRLQSGFQPLGI